MKVSVVLCTYSPERYDDFSEAADSVLAQTYDQTELVIVVDGTESVYEQVREDYGPDEQVEIYCNEKNRGLLESRNQGAEIATGDVVAFIDDDAIADEYWIEELVRSYDDQDAIAVGGKMIPEWVAGKPRYLPEEFYWLVGVTHRGYADEPGYVRNTFGSNISFRRDVFLELGGFDSEIGGRKGDKNLQGGETELCARLAEEYNEQVWYNPAAVVAHKVFEYRREPGWLLNRAFWQGYSKWAMKSLVEENGNEESEYLKRLITEFFPGRILSLLKYPSFAKASQLLMLVLFTAAVGLGYVYGAIRY